jgi:outer membrane lipoprotein carrier protein
MRLLGRLTFLAVLTASTFVAAQAPPTAAELAARIQARYATVQDFTAEFTQSSTSALISKPVQSRGQLKVKKPNRMRWTYTSDDRNEMVVDGKRFYMYFPKDRYVSDVAITTQSSTGLLFLGGRANIARDFVPSLPPSQPATEWRLMLAPKTSPADFKTIAIDVDRKTFAFRGFVVTDEEGGVNTFRLSNVRENQQLPDADFLFTPPKGVEVRRQ